MMKNLLSMFMLLFAVATAHATDFHVATTGSDTNDGSEAAPLLTIGKALEIVQPGDRILIHEGTYYITKRLKIPALNTKADMRCEMRAWPDDAAGKVIIDGTNMVASTEIEFKQSRCIYVNHEANFWTFYGLVLQNALDSGMKMEGSYNVVERCTFRYNNDTGLQIGMFKDFSIEETKSFPISGIPEYNPNYTYCRGNKVINCDSYDNADIVSYGGGTDDGGDADGFAVKLFPGPGTQFYGCRAWNNSDDNWDLYMTYHPVVIDHCWAYHAGHYTDKNGTVKEGKNGNGFKLGGGGSAGGAAFDQSTGAHVVTNCVAFDNLHKGFDQNNAFEGMYVINCTAWGNEYNYRFPTYFMYGSMTIRNSIGWGATALDKKKNPVGNHEFLSPGAEAEISVNGKKVKVTNDKMPDTQFNSWTDFDGCHIIKESYKPDGQDYTPATKDHSDEFLSLSVADFMAEREADGSLPNNNFARLKPNSIFKDAGTPIIGFTPARKMTETECTAVGLEYLTADDLYIPYNDAAPDLGAYETDGVPYEFVIPEKILLNCTTDNKTQEVMEGQPIADIVYEWNDVATGADVENLPAGLTYNISGNTLTISGTPTEGGTFTITAHADATSQSKPVSSTCVITLVTPYRVLTGDWYHCQDEITALPTDMQNVLSLVKASSSDSYTKLDPEYIDAKGLPGGCTVGAIVMGRSGGGAKWTFPNGALQMKINLHITGKRTFKIVYKLAGEQEKTVTVSDVAANTYIGWNILDKAGLSEADALKLESIQITNSSSTGECRIYDMYIRVPLTETGINNVNANANGSTQISKVIKSGRMVIVKDGNSYNAQGQRIF